MEGLKYVSPEYNQRLIALAERLCTPERYGKKEEPTQELGQLALVETVEVQQVA